jgi:uncharacterized protein YkwD
LGRNISAVLVAALLMLIAASAILLAAPIPAGALATSATTRGASCAYANLRPTRANTATVDGATLCLIDQVRTAYHLRALRSNQELQTVASTLVSGMVRSNYFGDNSPTGQSPGALIQTIPYGAHAADLSTAQDLGWGTLSAATPAGIVKAWMHSPPHRAIILTAEFRDAGIGVAPSVPPVIESGKRGATYAVEFATRG